MTKQFDENSRLTIEQWSEIRYGMIIHYGLYSLLERGEWVLNRERIPIGEYKELMGQFTAEKFDADALCDLAVRAGMGYIIFTTMHVDGFRLYDTKLSDFNSMNAACGRDLTAEIVAAARRRGLKVALYHALTNWTATPDAVAALEDPKAYEKFIADTHARYEELVRKFNPIDVLWYDGWWPFNAERWQAAKLAGIVQKIQPGILVNGRNGLPGDFATPEGHLTAPKPWRPWEACMTHNNNWGYHAGDDEWKTPGQVVDMLATVAIDHGNLVLNVGPHGDGSIPKQTTEVFEAVGAWLKRCGECVMGTDRFTFGLMERGDHRSDWCHHGPFTAKGNNFYLLLRRWPGREFAIGGVDCKVLRTTLLGVECPSLKFEQIGERLVIKGLPATPPDPVCTVLKFECDRPPVLYLTCGMRVPNAPHPPYDPCPSDLAHG